MHSILGRKQQTFLPFSLENLEEEIADSGDL
jgi:hypothetical protein